MTSAHFDLVSLDTFNDFGVLRKHLESFVDVLPVPDCVVQSFVGKVEYEGPVDQDFQCMVDEGFLHPPGCYDFNKRFNFPRRSPLVVGTTICRNFPELFKAFDWSGDGRNVITLIKTDDRDADFRPCYGKQQLIKWLKPYYEAIHPEYSDLVPVFVGHEQYWYPRAYVPPKFWNEEHQHAFV